MKVKYDAVVVDKKDVRLCVSGIVESDDVLLMYADISKRLLAATGKKSNYQVVSLSFYVIDDKGGLVSYPASYPQDIDTPITSYEVALMDKKGKLHIIPSFPVHAFDRIAKLSKKMGTNLYLVETRRTLSSSIRMGFYKESIIKTSISEA